MKLVTHDSERREVEISQEELDRKYEAWTVLNENGDANGPTFYMPKPEMPRKPTLLIEIVDGVSKHVDCGGIVKRGANLAAFAECVKCGARCEEIGVAFQVKWDA